MTDLKLDDVRFHMAPVTAAVPDLAAALVKVQPRLEHPKKHGINPHLGNKFADLNATIDANREALSEHGLCVLQTHESRHTAQGQLVTVRTVLLHQSGQAIESYASVLVEGLARGCNMAQTIGQYITYLRRYGWLTIVGISGEDDEDGGPQLERGGGGKAAASNGGGGGQKKEKPKEPPPPKDAEEAYERSMAFAEKCVAAGDVAGIDLCIQRVKEGWPFDRANLEQLLLKLDDARASAAQRAQINQAGEEIPF